MSATAELWGAEQYGWINRHYYGPVPYYICNPKVVENNDTGPVGVG